MCENADQPYGVTWDAQPDAYQRAQARREAMIASEVMILEASRRAHAHAAFQRHAEATREALSQAHAPSPPRAYTGADAWVA